MQILNIIIVLSLLYIIYSAYIEYYENKKFESDLNEMIYTFEHDLFDEYKQSKIYRMWANCSADDKKFIKLLFKYLIYTDYKQDKPKKSNIRLLKDDLLLGNMASILLNNKLSSYNSSMILLSLIK